MTNYALSDWLISDTILISTTEGIVGFALFSVLAILAAFSKAPRLHEAMAVLMLLATTVGFFFEQP